MLESIDAVSPLFGVIRTRDLDIKIDKTVLTLANLPLQDCMRCPSPQTRRPAHVSRRFRTWTSLLYIPRQCGHLPCWGRSAGTERTG